MGVYFPGQFLTTCSRCIANNDDYRCDATGELLDDRIAKTSRMPNCPAINVQQHGRLIDADALYTHIKDEQRKCNDPYDGWSECQVALGFVNTAPTIIPAEEGE